jgi:hypothetical protein
MNLDLARALLAQPSGSWQRLVGRLLEQGAQRIEQDCSLDSLEGIHP